MIDGKSILVSKTLKEFEKQLPCPPFFRIHKTYLINIEHVVNYVKGRGGQVEMRTGKFLDVAREKKQSLMDILIGK